MGTVFGKLTMLAFVLVLGVLLLAPMRAGVEDALTASVDSVSLNPGETLEVCYSLRSESAQTVVYSSDDPVIATVDQQGLVTALEPGQTHIRLKAQGGASDAVKVEVTGVPVTSIALNTKLLVMDKGDVSGLSCTFNAGATDQRVEWLSADPDIVKVDAAGRVTAVGSGETYVVATTPGGLSAAATVCVRVRGTAVQIVPGALTVGVGTTFQLGVHYLPEDTTDDVVSWKSSQPGVLSVDADGRVRAISTGTATVSVLTEAGLKGETEIVVEPAARDFQINPTNATLERGDVQTLEAWFIGTDGQRDDSVNHHIEWTSSNPSVATVTDGVVTARASGRTVITATADGISATCAVRVQTMVRSVSLNMDELYLLREQTGEPFQLKAALEPADADDLRLTYVCDNEQVANVSRDGLVTLTGGYGTAVITVSAASGAEDTFTVHVVSELPQTQDVASVRTDVAE